jgi:UDP-glucose 4-epimerase
MILVTGAAGYIGSHVTKKLLEQGEIIVALDNFSTGIPKSIESLQKIKKFDFINLDLKEFIQVRDVFLKYKIETVIHLAAYSQVNESMKEPLKYYLNNTVNTTNLVKHASNFGVKHFIFSSTAAVYGEPKLANINDTITENYETTPINPYGQSKLMAEKIIKDESLVNKSFKYCILRYFNVAGSDMDSDIPRIGESHDPETHLIPLVAKTALGKREEIKIFGDNHNTPDGTCIRDYIHVDDLVDAHLSSIEFLKKNISNTFNCGYGHGFSVKEVIKMLKKASGVDFHVQMDKKRDGDPAILVANNEKILKLTNWNPRYDDLEIICKSALAWEKVNLK